MASLNYRPEIDGLRAIAVAAVVAYHVDPRVMPGGFVGVDAFFVISGYLITALLHSEWSATGRIDFAAFYARRVRRLLPALTVLVLAVMAVAMVAMGRHGAAFEQTGDSAVASLLMFANFHFQAHSGGYFQAPAESMALLHLWSLSVEEQFYLVYPALLLLLLRLVPTGVIKRLVAISVMSLLLAEFWAHYQPGLAFYQMPARFWELAAGSVIALSAVPAATRPSERWLMFAGVLGVVVACLFTPLWPRFPGVGALPAVIGASLVLLGVHRRTDLGFMGRILRSRPLVGLGLLSYSLYLWHWPLLVIDANISFEGPTMAWRWLLCGVALVLAYLSWRFVEMPFRRSGSSSPRRALLAGLAVTALAVTAVVGLARVDRVPAQARQAAEFARNDTPPDLAGCHFDHDDRPSDLRRADCRSNRALAPAVAIWGDSHAFAWKPFAWRVAEAEGASAAGATMNNCAPSGLPAAGAAGSPCTTMNQMALGWFESGEVTTLIIALRWPWAETEGEETPAAIKAQLDGLGAALARLDAVPRIMVIGPLPVLKRPAPTCIMLGWEQACAVSRQQFERSSSAAWAGLRLLASRHPNVVLVDPTDYFCNDTTCPVMRDGHALFWDGNHVSATAARDFAGRYLAEPARYTAAPGRSP